MWTSRLSSLRRFAVVPTPTTVSRRFLSSKNSRTDYVSLHTKRHINQRTNSSAGWLIFLVAGVAGVASAVVMAYCDDSKSASLPPQAQLRSRDFFLIAHNHGQTRVRVLKVDRNDEQQHTTIQEYSVTTTVFSEETEKCFTQGDNHNLVASDTLKNNVYVVAKKYQFNSPEQFSTLLANHLLEQYPWLDAAGVHVSQTSWSRVQVDGRDHPHGFIKTSPETQEASVYQEREQPPVLQSAIAKMTVLKTTMSGLEGYHSDDPYTTLPPTKEQCLATELDAVWTYTPEDTNPDYNTIREEIRQRFYKGIFGPAETGVYSKSLQSTVYDAVCMILTDLPQVETISIYTPNLDYLPTANLLQQLGEKFENDVFIPTSEPSGVINCTISRYPNDDFSEEVVEVMPDSSSPEKPPVVQFQSQESLQSFVTKLQKQKEQEDEGP